MQLVTAVAVMPVVVVDTAEADMAVGTAAITARVTDLAPAFRCPFPSLVVGKLVPRSPKGMKIDHAFAAS
jgi:hypothetical protein